MTGLDMVKGPHWSQILQLFGPNGSISDILKDRSQVQLKDKARNLKLFFLKTASEMPFYLQHVTGELKTRAPTQAARKEAEEKARLNTEEEQARVQGIMTLAGGLQNNAPNNQPAVGPRPPQPQAVASNPRGNSTTAAPANNTTLAASARAGVAGQVPAQLQSRQAMANNTPPVSMMPQSAPIKIEASPSPQMPPLTHAHPPPMIYMSTQQTPNGGASQPSHAPPATVMGTTNNNPSDADSDSTLLQTLKAATAALRG